MVKINSMKERKDILCELMNTDFKTVSMSSYMLDNQIVLEQSNKDVGIMTILLADHLYENIEFQYNDRIISINDMHITE